MEGPADQLQRAVDHLRYHRESVKLPGHDADVGERPAIGDADEERRHQQLLYDINGNRTKKVANGVTTEYYLNEGTIVAEKKGSELIRYLFDENGNRFGLEWKNVQYYYVFNGQGDVIGITDPRNRLAVPYTYDAWGKLLNTGGDNPALAAANPIRYRGYYYDTETDLYYLNSRYYDPETGRFINADTITDGGAKLLGYNLFIYAANNPTNYSDATGQWIFKDAIKWVAKNIVKPIVKKVQETLSKVDCTQSVGFTGSASPGIFMFSGSVGVSWDTKGNVVLQASGNVDVTTTATPTWSVTKHHTTTNAPTVNDLQGPGYEMGGSAQIPLTPVVVGAEGVFLENTQTDETYYGVTYSGGIGSGYEFHAGGGGTTNVSQTFNVFDELDKLYIKIMEW